MEFLTSMQIFLICVLSGILSLLLFYYVIKAAVKNGMIEANQAIYKTNLLIGTDPDKTPSPEQFALKKKYDKGEISFEQFQVEWKKLL